MKSRIEQALASAPEALSTHLAPIVLADDLMPLFLNNSLVNC